jgi:hypothetical protein
MCFIEMEKWLTIFLCYRLIDKNIADYLKITHIITTKYTIKGLQHFEKLKNSIKT